MPTISFNSKAPPTEKTPLGISFENKHIPQGKNARSFFYQVVVVTLSSVVLGLIAVAYLSSSASSSVAKQSLLRSVNKQLYETDSNVVPTASLIESESQTDLEETTDLIELPVCPASCGPEGNGVECCTNVGAFPDKCYLEAPGKNTCKCYLNAPGNTCQCLSGPNNTKGAPCTISPVVTCPANCGPQGNGKECCTKAGPLWGTCYLNAPGNTCECLSGPNNTKGAPCTIKNCHDSTSLPWFRQYRC